MTVESALDFHEESERLRLAECVQEPIRTPGRIQVHGALLAVGSESGVIEIASENVGGWLGRPASELGSASLDRAIASGTSVDPSRVRIDDAEFDAIVFRVDGRVVVELEPVDDTTTYVRTGTVRAIERLLSLHDVGELLSAAADEVRRVSGYDRVLVYRFYDDDHGEVVGESSDPAAGFEPYLGLHFPASDIPLQARELYVTKRSRCIASTTLDTWQLVASDEDAAPLDLADSELRAVSPHHLEYMRNMGQAATVSLSLVHDGRLIGMITCAHGTPRRLPVLLRRALEVLAATLTAQLISRQQIDALERALRASQRRSELLAPLAASGDVLATLLDGASSVLDLVPADGVVVRVGGTVRSVGDVPASNSGSLLDAIGAEPLETDSVARTHPDLALLLPGIAGVLALPLGDSGDRIVFLRREVAQVVRWMGDLSSSNRDTPLSPRRSFSEWKQSVSGTSMPWRDGEQEAAELAVELRDVLARRADAALARLAVVDPLTGLHNRRFLVEHVQQDVAAGRHAAALFFDLDDFKGINDRFGHDAGDHVLRVVAERLRAGSRAEDIVARLGGDEFVVYCAASTSQEIAPLAERLVAAVGETIALEGRELRVTVSCGLADVDPAEAFLESADAAMYRAKRAGRGRVSR